MTEQTVTGSGSRRVRRANPFGDLTVFRRVWGALAMPAGTFLLMQILCRLFGTDLFVGGVGGNFDSFVKTLCYLTLLSFAVSIHLHTGRMGFEVGAVTVLSAVTGFAVGIATGDGLVPAVLAAVLCGTLLHLLVGLSYVLLRQTSMIVSLGLTLIYEAVAYLTVRRMAYGGNVETLALKYSLTPTLLDFGRSVPLLLLLTLLAVFVMMFFFHYTGFGYRYRALQSGQKIAVQTGIREVRNALFCYLISGALLGICGLVNYSFVSAVRPTLNFGTVPIMFECFCPLFFGGFIQKYCNKQIAVLSGVLSYSLIQVGLGQIRIALNWNNYVIPLINATILVVFMIWQSNRGRLAPWLRRLTAGRKGADASCASRT